MLRIRAAVTLIGAVALYGMYLTLATPWVPDKLHVVLVATFWGYMLAFSKTWPRSGMPPQMHNSHGRKRKPPPQDPPLYCD